eukprot:3155385-Prymnesium_polylepis.1
MNTSVVDRRQAFLNCRKSVNGSVPVKMLHACERGVTDQTLLNSATGNKTGYSWRRLPARFNRAWKINSDGLPRYGSWRDVDVVHFVGDPKPWTTGNQSGSNEQWLNRLWFKEACSSSTSMGGLLRNAAGVEAMTTPDHGASVSSIATSNLHPKARIRRRVHG